MTSSTVLPSDLPRPHHGLLRHRRWLAFVTVVGCGALGLLTMGFSSPVSTLNVLDDNLSNITLPVSTAAVFGGEVRDVVFKDEGSQEVVTATIGRDGTEASSTAKPSISVSFDAENDTEGVFSSISTSSTSSPEAMEVYLATSTPSPVEREEAGVVSGVSPAAADGAAPDAGTTDTDSSVRLLVNRHCTGFPLAIV